MNKFILIIILAFIPGCTGGGSGGETGLIAPGGNSPTIDFPQITQSRDGLNTRIRISFDFVDLDGDVTTGKVLKLNNDELITIDLLSYTGVKFGTIKMDVLFDTTSILTWDFKVWIIDSKGRESNKETQTFTVEEKNLDIFPS